MKIRSLVFPMIMICFSLVALIFIQGFEAPMFQDASVDAKFFPRVIAIAILIISLLLILQEKIKPSLQTIPPIFSKMAIYGFLYLIGYAVLIHFIGYLYATLAAFTLYLICFKVKKPSYYVTAWLFVFGIYYLFSEVFIISLPEGALFF